MNGISYESFLQQCKVRYKANKSGNSSIKIYHIEDVSFAENTLVVNNMTYSIVEFVIKLMKYTSITVSNPSKLKDWKGWNKPVMEFKIPVEYTVWGTILVLAQSLEEAVKYVIENRDEINLPDEPEYIDGTFRVSGEDEFDSTNIKGIAKYIRDYYNM